MPERFYCTEQLGAKQHMTPEGFLVIEDTPIARTGNQDYLPRELPLDKYDFAPAPDGVYHVHRPAEEVFHPRAMMSANGKAVTNDHPWEDVTVDNWRSLAIGDIYNPRRLGEVLVADIVIKDRTGIEFVRNGKRELSCGYDVDYYETAPGQLVQRNIRINHVALVDRGRCGAICAIGDEHPSELPAKETAMSNTTTVKKSTFKERFLGILTKAVDEAEAAGEGVAKNMGGVDTEGEGGGPFKVENHIYAGAPTDRRAGDEGSEVEKRVEKLEKDVRGIGDNVKAMRDSFDAFLKSAGKDADDPKDPDNKTDDDDDPDETAAEKAAEKDRKAKDAARLLEELRAEAPTMTADALSAASESSFLMPSFRDTVAGAEVLSPGIQVPTFSEKAKPAATFDSICKLRRSALDAAYKQQDTRHMIEAVMGVGRVLDTTTMTCGETRNVFRAVVGMKRQANDARSRNLNSGLSGYNGSGEQPGGKKPIRTLHDLQTSYDEFYKKTA